MNYILILIFILFLKHLNVFCTKITKDNVGTVLFTASDSLRNCWSDEDMAMLTSRMFFEDILPCDLVFNIENDSFILSLIEYFRLVVTLVRNSATGKTKHILLLALSDCLGGYLHHTALPLARYAYYSGNIRYESIEKLYELYDELKLFLRTDGKSWAPPIQDFQKFKTVIRPIPLIADEGIGHSCDELIYYDNKDSTEHMYIPMPFFDSRSKPHSIAIPFRNYSLRNIQDKSAAFILVKYFVTAVKCLTIKNAEKKSLGHFYKSFDYWIVTEVLPHLNDDKFYSAFGGVYRVLESLKKAEEVIGLNRKDSSSYEIMQTNSQAAMREAKIHNSDIVNPNYEPLVPIEEETGGEKRLFKRDENSGFEDYGSPYYGGSQKKLKVQTACTKAPIFFFWDEDHTKSLIVVLSLLTVLLLWFCLGMIYLCYRLHKKKKCSFDPKTRKCKSRACSALFTKDGKENNDVTIIYAKKPEKSPPKLEKKRSKCRRGLLMSSSGHTFRSNKVVECRAPVCVDKITSTDSDLNKKAKRAKKKPFVYGYDYKTTSEDTSPGSKSSTTTRSTEDTYPSSRIPRKVSPAAEKGSRGHIPLAKKLSPRSSKGSTAANKPSPVDNTCPPKENIKKKGFFTSRSRSKSPKQDTGEPKTKRKSKTKRDKSK